MSDVPSSPSRLATLWRRRAVRWALALFVAAFVAGPLLSLVVGPLVDWGMDGDLSPGEWHPRYLVIGMLLSTLYLGTLVFPAAALFLLVLIISVACGERDQTLVCPGCRRTISDADLHADCGPLPARAPTNRFRDAFGRVPSQIARRLPLLSACGLLLVPTLFSACGLSWVQLELEEDAFGRRAKAAAARGAMSHSEVSRHQGHLFWNADSGYSSHRD